MCKKIVIYGENWTGTLPQLLHSSLKDRGFQVSLFDYSDIMPGIKNRTFIEKIMRRLFYKIYSELINIRFLKYINDKDPDIIIIVKGLDVKISTLKKIKKKSVKLINWNPDDFFNMKNSSKNLISSIVQYDLIISSRPHLFEKYYKFGANKMIFIDWYYIPDLHFPQNKKKDIKISFVGSWSKYREEFIAKMGEGFVIMGSGWEKSAPEFKKKHDVDPKILSQRKMSEVFERSCINLNILTPDNSDLTNLRFFEAPASGGLLLTEKNNASIRYLKNNEECLMYSSVDEAREIISKDIDFDKISKAGHMRILKDQHSFSDRVTEFLESIA
jgi:spore maturation protein CgeB